MKKGIYSTMVAALLTAAVFALPILNPGISANDSDKGVVDKAPMVITNPEKKPVTLPEVNALKSDETVTFIIETEGTPLCDAVKLSKGKYKTVVQLLRSKDARQYTDTIKKNQAVVKAGIRKILPEVNLDNSYTYNTVFCGFSVIAPYSTLARLQNITGVKSVTLASEGKMVISEYEDEESSETEEQAILSETPDMEKIEIFPQITVQNTDMGIDSAYKQGYSGKGKVIAVIDDSFYIAHEAFSEPADSPKYTADDIKTFQSAVSFNTDDKSEVAKNKKVIFAYDYADRDSDTYSSDTSHGTKVASVIAGNNGSEFKSGAYDSQLIFMKVCGDEKKSVNDSVLLAAIDDTAKLSPDIVNISLGVPRLCVTAGLFDKALDRLSETGSHVIAAAGNYAENVDTNEDYGIRSSYTDYGTISYPASLSVVTAAGASNTSRHYGKSLITDKNNKFEYSEISTSHNETSPEFSDITKMTDYIFTDSYGSIDELRLFDLKDKIAVVKRGKITIDEKIKAAEDIRAAGVLIISDEPLYAGFTAEKRNIPAAAVSSASLSYFSLHTQGKLCSTGESDVFSAAKTNIPAPFTSYGVSSDLRLKPDLLASGTDIYCADNDNYSRITGTSASAAEISAAAAILYEYIENIPDIPQNDRQKAVCALMMNNSDRLKYGSNNYYTPRLQGAGRLNMSRALSAPVIITTSGINSAVSMGSSEEGKYTFTLSLQNISEDQQTMNIGNHTQTDKLVQIDGEYYNTLTPISLTEYTDVIFSIDGEKINDIVLEPGESKNIDVEITLSPAAALAYLRMAPNGFYVDGYIEFVSNENGVLMSVPYMGYCGVWELADIFDTSVYETDEEPLISGNSLYAAASMGNSYPGVRLGMNFTTGEIDKTKICIGRDTVKNCFDAPTAGNSFIIPDYYLLRDAAEYTIIIKDSAGKNIFTQKLGNISSFVSGGYKAYTGLLQSFNSDALKNLFSTLKEGKYTYVVSASAVTADVTSSGVQSVSYDFTVDNTPPSKPAANTYTKDGRIYLELSSSDVNGVQGFMLYTASGSNNQYHYGDKLDDLIGSSYMNDDSYILTNTEYHDNTATFTYDITYLYNQLKRVKLIAASINIDSLSELKLAVRAIDSAYNFSDTSIADSCVSGNFTYHLTDQNGKPVEGVQMAAGGVIMTSDKYGIVKFSSMLPDYYGVKIISVPDEYETEFTSEAVFTTLDKKDYSKEIKFTFSGEYPVEESKEESNLTSTEKIQKTEIKESYFDNDNSVFGLVFIAVVIAGFSSSLIISFFTKKKLSSETGREG